MFSVLSHRPLWGGLVASGFITLLAGVGILATDEQQANHDWGWALAGIGVAAMLVGAVVYLWLTRGDDASPKASASAKNHSAAVAVGRDLKGNVYMAPPLPVQPTRAVPSFEIQHQPRSDGWVHLLLTNYAEAGMFHVDVTRIEKAVTDETTPYPVKWRGYPQEDRQVVKEALIDLAYVEAPRYDDPNSAFARITSRRHVNNWFVGRFVLYSYSCQEGWDVEANRAQGPDSMPPQVALYLEEVVLRLRATRIDSGEELERTVTIGFTAPMWNDQANRWEPSKGIRVEVTG